MQIVTIPKQLIQKNDDLVLIQRKDYETLLRYQPKKVSEIVLTLPQRRSLAKARTNFIAGTSLTIHELKRKLAITH